VGDIKLDHQYWGRPENMNMQRPAYAVDAKRPGSDLMGSAAAGLAAASVALKQDSAQSAVLYLARAELLYKMATKNRGLYNKFIPTSTTYPSATYFDDLAWAAAWLYRATQEDQYLADAETFWATSMQTEKHINPNSYIWNYENQLPGVMLMLEEFTGKEIYTQYTDEFVNSWMKGEDGLIFYTPKGLAKAEPAGTLQHTANAAFFTMLYASRRPSNRFMALNCWARTQIGYMLGDGGRSFVAGYGGQRRLLLAGLGWAGLWAAACCWLGCPPPAARCSGVRPAGWLRFPSPHWLCARTLNPPPLAPCSQVSSPLRSRPTAAPRARTPPRATAPGRRPTTPPTSTPTCCTARWWAAPTTRTSGSTTAMSTRWPTLSRSSTTRASRRRWRACRAAASTWPSASRATA
jgi:hypothetical protein